MTRRLVLAVLLTAVLYALYTWLPLFAGAGPLDPNRRAVPDQGPRAPIPVSGLGGTAATPEVRTGVRAASDATYKTYLPFISRAVTIDYGDFVFSTDLKTVTITVDGTTWTIQRPTTPQSTFSRASSSNRYIWVAPTGSDNNIGDSTSPYLTIGKAVRSAVSGDVIYVRAGFYTETVRITTGGIVLSAAPGEMGLVHLTPAAADAQYYEGVVIVDGELGARNVVVNGLVIEGYREWSGVHEEHYTANGITFEDWATGTASNNIVYHALHSGIKEMGHGGSGVIISGNVTFRNGTKLHNDHGIYAPMDNGLIIGNVAFDNAGYGIHSYLTDDPPQNQTIALNVTWGNHSGGIVVQGNNTKVYNNTSVYNNALAATWLPYAYSAGIMHFGDTNSDVRDNIFAFNSVNGAFQENLNASGITDDYNIYYRTDGVYTYDPHPRIPRGSNDIMGQNPLFVNAGSLDFRLGSGSPAICTGVDLGYGTNRGAYQ